MNEFIENVVLLDGNNHFDEDDEKNDAFCI